MSKSDSKLAQLRVLQKNTDKSLQSFIDEAYKILGNPIILYDLDWKILAYTEDNTSFWDNIINNGMIRQEILESYLNEGSGSAMINPNQQVIYLDNEYLKHHGIFGKVYDNNSLPIACVNIVEKNKPLTDGDLIAIKTLCEILTNEICKIPYYQKYSQSKLDVYISKLINDEISDKIYSAGYIEMIYKNLKENLYLAVVDISKTSLMYENLDCYRDLFKQIQPAYKYSVYSNHIVIVIGMDEAFFHPKKCFGNLYKIFDRNNIKVGISSRFENLFELSRYYREAVIALNNGLENNRRQHFFLYSEGIYNSN